MTSRKEIDQFILDLQALKLRAAELKLGGTVKALDQATQKVGWEYAKRIELAEKNKDEV